jgi:hypothetical protein
MKNLQIFAAMLVFAVPALAVTIHCTDEGNGVVRIDYDATDEDFLPLAFALDITVDNGATIDVISDYIVGDSTAVQPGYGIFPRSMLFDDTGRMIDGGFPDVEPDGNTVGVQPGLGTNGVTIEMATRYSGIENAPLKSDMLLKIEVNNHDAQIVNVNITPNIAGGGVVLKDATVANVTAIGCVLDYSDGNLPTNELPIITSLTALPTSIYDDQTSLLQVIANDADASPSALTYNWVIPAGAGSIADAASPNTTYSPPNVTATQTFTITAEVSDGQDVVSSIVSITVLPRTSEPPVIDPDVVTIKKAEYKVGDKELRVEALSSAQPDATLTVAGYGTMVWKADKNKYELRIKPVADPGGPITVTSDLGGTATKSLTYKDLPDEPPQQDVVIIKKAEYKVGDKELRVEATSSAQPNATLTVVGYGKMVWKAKKNKYELRIKPIANPGGSVTVTSDAGASATKTVTLK